MMTQDAGHSNYFSHYHWNVLFCELRHYRMNPDAADERHYFDALGFDSKPYVFKQARRISMGSEQASWPSLMIHRSRADRSALHTHIGHFGFSAIGGVEG